jgi:hypothetical protein
LSALLVGLNLHEWRADDRSVRGWPFIALVNGPYFLHHNRIEPLGLAIDVAIAASAVLATLRLRAPSR